jgi:hypothetical protein
MSKKLLSPDFERDTLQTSYEDYSCAQCLEPITNPLCHECLGNQVHCWLGLYPSIKKKMQPQLKKYVVDVNNNVLQGIKCASCRKKQAALCPYCFSEGIFNMLKKNRVDRMVIMDFLSTFNFDLKHEGYIREAINEGLY